MGGRLGLPPHLVLDCTVREIISHSRGNDAKGRSDMAAMLWAAREGAIFNAHAFAGKRIPVIDKRIKAIVDGKGPADTRRGEIGNVIERMNQVAMQAGMPPPKPRAKKARG